MAALPWISGDDFKTRVPQATCLHGEHAVVIGGSLAGLIAATVLSRHFRRVTVIENELIRDYTEPRTLCPQADHLHILLQRGQMLLERFFGGITKEMESAGISPMDFASDFCWFQSGSWKRRFRSDVTIYPQSRHALEARVRRRVGQIDNVGFVYGAAVTSLLITHECITGVEYQSTASGQTAQLASDFTVDACGRRSRSGRWLRQLGFDSLMESRTTLNLCYSTRIYHQLPSGQEDWRALSVGHHSPSCLRGGNLYPIEDHKWIVSLYEYRSGGGPRSVTDFMSFAESLIRPDLHEVLLKAKPASDITTYRFPYQYCRRFHSMNRRPRGLIILGDAFASLDPLFGQGITLLLQQALCLAAALNEPVKDIAVASSFFNLVAETMESAWTNARVQGMDDGHSDSLSSDEIRHRDYYSRLYDVCSVDDDVHLMFLKVMHMLEVPEQLMRPWIASRVELVASSGIPLVTTQKPTKSEVSQPERIRRPKTGQTSKTVLFLNGPAQDPSDRFFGLPTSLLYAIAPAVDAIRTNDMGLSFVSRVFDPWCYVEGVNSDSIDRDFERQIADVDIICGSATYDALYPTIKLFSLAKQRNPKIVTVLGGPHFDEVHSIRGLNDVTVSSTCVDYGIAGDGEYGLLHLLAALGAGVDVNVQEIASRSSGRLSIYDKEGNTASTSKPLDLDGLPTMPIELARDLHTTDFSVFSEDGSAVPTCQMLAMRGCPYSCLFCSERKALAYPNCRSVENIMAEVYLRKEQGFRAVFFDDSTFSAHPDIGKLLRELGRTGMKFGCLNRFNSFTRPDDLDLYRDAGFVYMYCSIEQLDDRILRDIKKEQRVASINRSMRMLHESGMRLGVSLLFGLASETERSIRETLEFTQHWVDQGLIRVVSQSVLSLHPGTPMGSEMKMVVRRTPPHRGFPWNQFEEGQWCHLPHVTAEHLSAILEQSEARFSSRLVRRSHGWSGSTRELQ